MSKEVEAECRSTFFSNLERIVPPLSFTCLILTDSFLSIVARLSGSLYNQRRSFPTALFPPTGASHRDICSYARLSGSSRGPGHSFAICVDARSLQTDRSSVLQRLYAYFHFRGPNHKPLTTEGRTVSSTKSGICKCDELRGSWLQRTGTEQQPPGPRGKTRALPSKRVWFVCSELKIRKNGMQVFHFIGRSWTN